MKRLVALLLFASPLFAQTPVLPVQTVLTPVGNPQTSFTITVPNTKPGDMLFLYGFFAPNPVVTDTQGNVWIQVNADYQDVFYVPASIGGPETYTVTYTSAQYFLGVYYEFQGSRILKDVIPPRCLASTCSPYNPGQSLKYDTDTTTPCSFPLTTTVDNELVVNYLADNNVPPFPASEASGAPGWALGAFVQNFAAQATILAAPTTIAGCITVPMIPNGIFATAGIAGFAPMSTQPCTTNSVQGEQTHETITAMPRVAVVRRD
jgi:hypothetical protein